VTSPKPVTEWIRHYVDHLLGFTPPVQFNELVSHTTNRIRRPLELILSRVAMGYLRYESNRGRSPCYREWLQQALDRYDQIGNIDALLDVAFYAMAEFENPSKEGTFYESERKEREEL
jgi:hypothetical protein